METFLQSDECYKVSSHPSSALKLSGMLQKVDCNIVCGR